MPVKKIIKPTTDAGDIRYLAGIGPKRAEALAKLGLSSVEDLLQYYPRRHEDRSNLLPIEKVIPGEYYTIQGKVLSVKFVPIPRMPIIEVMVGDETGFIYAQWFNQPFMKRLFAEGETVLLSGRVEVKKSRLIMMNPEHEKVTHEDQDMVHVARIVPIYPLTEGLGQKGIRRAMKNTVDRFAERMTEFLPPDILRRYQLIDRVAAIRNIHFPDSDELLQQARKRLVFEEFFIFQLAVLQKIHATRLQQKSPVLNCSAEASATFMKQLPFSLTASQDQVLRELTKDLGAAIPMRRLLQGDVGSGKTVLAAFALFLAAQSGYQGVLLVPTEVLAEQHYRTLSKLLQPLGVQIAFLTGSIPANEKAEILSDIRNAKKQVVIGTHAVIQEGVRFAKLGVAVIDEQHKFGVEQRSVLLGEDKKQAPHLLVMTATPIPRTLGLTLYGDLELSTLKDMPAGRLPVKTFWIDKKKETEIFAHVLERVKLGEQAYIIYPVIDENQKNELLAARKEYERLQKGQFAGVSLGLIHGRMKSAEKEAVMQGFRKNEIKILVATTVIEVGIDNPNATRMIIEHAERFGLSQLHQLRGRIGRGSKESFCFLFGDPTTEEGKKRLKIMTKIQDGFLIAEEDLKLRGPGDFLGTRQSGTPLFRIGDLVRDVEILLTARAEASSLLAKDAALSAYPFLQLKVRNESLELKELKG